MAITTHCAPAGEAGAVQLSVPAVEPPWYPLVLVPVRLEVRSMPDALSRSVTPVSGHGAALQRKAWTATIVPVAVPVTAPLKVAPASTVVLDASSVRRAYWSVLA